MTLCVVNDFSSRHHALRGDAVPTPLGNFRCAPPELDVSRGGDPTINVSLLRSEMRVFPSAVRSFLLTEYQMLSFQSHVVLCVVTPPDVLWHIEIHKRLKPLNVFRSRIRSPL